MIKIRSDLPRNRYSDEGMERLRRDILLRAKSDFITANYKSKRAVYNNKAEDYANEMILVFYFISSDWYRVLTNFESPQKDIFMKFYNKVNSRVKEYVRINIEKYAKKIGVELC